MISDHRRIVVVGTSGSGKTTLAKALARKLDLPHVEMDALHWGPGWSLRSDFPESVRSAVEGDRWVVDGNYGVVREQVWERATALIWLNYSFPVVLWRAISRTVRRLFTREVFFSGNRESLRMIFNMEGIPMWVLRTYARRRREYRRLLTEPRFGHLEVFEVRTPAEAAALMEARKRDGWRL